MIPYNLSGITFNAHDTECGAFHVFNPDRPEATDRLPDGMVEEMKAFIRITEGLRSFVDIGALFGVFSLVFTRHPNATAYAIEPSPWAWPFLLEHVEANKDHRIIPLQRFLGDTNGEAVSCGRDWKHVVANSAGTEPYSCTTTKLDDIPEIKAVDCMKIDVEAYECSVLRGARNTIERFKPVIFLECHLLTLVQNGESPESLMSLIKSLNYEPRRFDGSVLNSFDGLDMTRVICYPA